MALALLASLRRLAPQAQRRAVRQLCSASADGESAKTIDLGEIRVRQAAAAAAAQAAGGDAQPAADAAGKARRRRRSRVSSRTQPLLGVEQGSSAEEEAHAPAARATPAEAGPVEEAPLQQSPAALLRDAMSKASCWSAVLFRAEAAAAHPDAVFTALAASTRLAARAAEVPHLRADPRFAQLLRAVEQLVPAMDGRGLAAVLNAMVRLRVSPSDDTLRRVLDACAAKRPADFAPAELGRLRAAGAALGWALPATFTPRAARAAAVQPRPSVRELFGEELHAQTVAIHKGCATWEALLDTVAALDAAALHHVAACAALSKCTYLAAGAAQGEQLRADPRFAQLLRAVEALLPAMDAPGLRLVLRALLRLRVAASDETLRRALDACAARREQQQAEGGGDGAAGLLSAGDVARLRAAAAELGWAVPPALLE